MSKTVIPNLTHIAEKINSIAQLAKIKMPANAPLFICNDIGSLESTETDSIITKNLVFPSPDKNPSLPFPAMRCAWPKSSTTSKSGKTVAANGVLVSEGAEIHGAIYVELIDSSPKTTITTLRFIIARSTTSDEITLRANAYENGRWGQLDQDSPLLHGAWLMIVCLLHYFRSPYFQPVIASPIKTNGKSVQWVQSRSYYTVVHRRHSANKSEVKAGSVVRDSTAERIAHARRAHIRILRSPKWGAKQGIKIPVRASWVGPREWRDTVSMQVYRITDLGISTKHSSPKISNTPMPPADSAKHSTLRA